VVPKRGSEREVVVVVVVSLFMQGKLVCLSAPGYVHAFPDVVRFTDASERRTVERNARLPSSPDFNPTQELLREWRFSLFLFSCSFLFLSFSFGC